MANFQNSKQYLELMLQDKHKHIQIIAQFAILKNYNFENYQQILFFIKRNIRAAKRLESFDLNKIKQVLEYLLETADYKVGLETIEKFILEDIPELQGDKPIMIYNNEKVYNIKRLTELEKKNKIYYQNGTWKTKLNT